MCSSGCPTPGAHTSWGECVRAKGTRVAYCNSAAGMDATKQKKWDAELDAYKAARSQGIQPAGTKMRDIRKAVEVSNAVGKAYDASSNTFSDKGV